MKFILNWAILLNQIAEDLDIVMKGVRVKIKIFI